MCGCIKKMFLPCNVKYLLTRLINSGVNLHDSIQKKKKLTRFEDLRNHHIRLPGLGEDPSGKESQRALGLQEKYEYVLL